jgi:hypothetical protein
VEQNSFIPAFGFNFFACMRWLHRVADVLKQAHLCVYHSSKAFPDINTLNALRSFLELYRPRMIRRSTLESICTQFTNLPNMCRENYADLLDWMQATLAVLPPADNEWVPLEYNRRITLKDSTAKLFSMLSNKSEETAMLNWLIYVPIINNLFDAATVYELLCTDKHIMIPDLHPLKDVPQLYLGANSTPLEVNEYLAMYSKCFVTPYASSRIRLGPDYLQGNEPMHALMSIFRFVEQKVSRTPMRKAIEESMRNFDLDDFFAERPRPSVGNGLGPDRRSLLPIQAQNSRDVNTGHAAVSGFVFYETSLPILALSTTEFVFMQERTSSALGDDGTVGRSPIASAANLFLDTVLRFHKYLKLEDITRANIVGLSWKHFAQQMQSPLPPLCAYEDGPGLAAPYFGTPSGAIRYIEQYISPAIKKQLADQRQIVMEQLKEHQKEEEQNSSSNTSLELQLIMRLNRWYEQIPLSKEDINPRTGINETASFVAIMERERAQKTQTEKQQKVFVSALTSKLNSAVASARACVKN